MRWVECRRCLCFSMNLAPDRSSASKVEFPSTETPISRPRREQLSLFSVCSLWGTLAKARCNATAARRRETEGVGARVGQRVQWNLQQTKLLLNALRLQIACNEQSSRWVDHDVPEGEWVKTEPKVGGCESQRSGFGCRGGGSDL